MIITEEVYLEHYGVKGMRWGVRKTQKTPLTKAQIAARKKRNKKRIEKGFKLAIGAAYVASLLVNESKPKPKTNSYSYEYVNDPNRYTRARTNSNSYTKARTPTKSVSDLINAERNEKISAITRTFKEGYIDKDQVEKAVNVLNKRYDRKITEAEALK